MMCRKIGDPGEQQRRSIVLQNDMLILEDREPEAPEFGSPRTLAGIIFMIARDKVHAVAGREGRQGRRVRG